MERLGINRGSMPSNLDKFKTQFLETKLVVIDEMSMISPIMLYQIDKVLKSVQPDKGKKNDRFGGFSILFLGDFLQCKPVAAPALYLPYDHIKVTSRVYGEYAVKVKATTSAGYSIFQNLEKIEFVENRRCDCLELKVGLDLARNEDGPHLQFQAWLDSIQQLTLRDMLQESGGDDWSNASWIVPDNPVRHIINRVQINRFAKKNRSLLFQWRYTIPDSIVNLEDCERLFQDVPELTVTISMNCPVICTVNLNVDNGICNGLEGVITGIALSDVDLKRLRNLGDDDVLIVLKEQPKAILVKWENCEN